MSSGLGSGLGGLSRGLRRGTAFWVNSGVGAGSSLLGGATKRMLSQQGYTGSDMLWDGVVGAGLGNVPDMVRPRTAPIRSVLSLGARTLLNTSHRLQIH